MAKQSPFETVYHVEIFDESGAKLDINNLTREELDDFRFSHESDDLDYRIFQDLPRATRVRSHA